MFEYHTFESAVTGAARDAVVALAEEVFSTLSTRRGVTAEKPDGIPGIVKVPDLIDIAERLDVAGQPGFEVLPSEGDGVWLADNKGSHWRESFADRLFNLVNGCFIMEDFQRTLDLDEWRATLLGAFSLYVGALQGDPFNYLGAHVFNGRIDRPLDTPWGVLRPAVARDTGWAITHPGPETKDWWEDNAVLLTPIEIQWTPLDPTADFVADNPNGRQRSPFGQDYVNPDLVALVLLLTSSKKQSPDWWVTTHLDPFTTSSGGSTSPRLGWMRSLCDDRDAFEALSASLESRYNPKRQIAVQRAVTAAQKQRTPIDAVMDAAIAWENLLGRSKSEISFKLSAAAARLCSTKPDEREAMFKRFRSFYNMRSDVVHGDEAGRTVTPNDRETAIDLVITLVSASLTHSEDVWGMTSNGINRFIIGGR